MSIDLKFFYFGNQCPHSCYLLSRIKTIAWRERVKLHLFDVTDDPETCRKYQIFSPNMLVVNDKHRLHGPFTRERVEALLQDEGTEPRGYAVMQSDNVVRGELTPITSESVLGTSATCAGAEDEGLCRGKSEWVEEMLRKSGLKHVGYIHSMAGKCVGGAEFLPSQNVPYPIPDKRDDNAFLTCSYLSDAEFDFKTHPLERLALDLKEWGFTTLSVVASSDVVFPNGRLSWFEKRGFEDNGVLLTEKLHKAELHFMQLPLQTHLPQHPSKR